MQLPRCTRLRLAAQAAAAPSADYRTRAPGDVRVLVVGATGYIGKFVVQELVKRGYNVVAFARERSGIGGKKSAEDVKAELAGADVRFGDVGNMGSLRDVAFKDHVDVVVSCLASRTGGWICGVGWGWWLGGRGGVLPRHPHWCMGRAAAGTGSSWDWARWAGASRWHLWFLGQRPPFPHPPIHLQPTRVTIPFSVSLSLSLLWSRWHQGLLGH